MSDAARVHVRAGGPQSSTIEHGSHQHGECESHRHGECESHQHFGNTWEVVEAAGDCTYVQGEIKERKGVEWSSKEMDRCPLTKMTKSY
jgi:hypothetical protein